MLKHRRDKLADLKDSAFVFEEFEGYFYTEPKTGIERELTGLRFTARTFDGPKPVAKQQYWVRHGDKAAEVYVVKNIDLYLFVEDIIRRIAGELRTQIAQVTCFNTIYDKLEPYLESREKAIRTEYATPISAKPSDIEAFVQRTEHAKVQAENRLEKSQAEVPIQVLPDGEDVVAKRLEEKFNTSSKGPE